MPIYIYNNNKKMCTTHDTREQVQSSIYQEKEKSLKIFSNSTIWIMQSSWCWYIVYHSCTNNCKSLLCNTYFVHVRKKSRFEWNMYIFFLMKYNVKAIQLRLPSQFYIFFKEDRLFSYSSNLKYIHTRIQCTCSIFSQNGFIISILKACFVETITLAYN